MTEPVVVHEDDVAPRPIASRPPVPLADGWLRELLGPANGSRRFRQRVLRIRGRGLWPGRSDGEETVYVFAGDGWVEVDERGAPPRRRPVAPGTAILVPPRTGWGVGATPGHELCLLSVIAAAPGGGTAFEERSPVVIREEDQDPLPAGDDRTFKLLLDPRYGARHVTQFVGFIRRSKAPPHTHTYEEAIYALRGEGIAHIGQDRHEPIRAGTSVFLPPGTPHCLENRGEETLRLLGVFSPPGSPAAKREGSAHRPEPPPAVR